MVPNLLTPVLTFLPFLASPLVYSMQFYIAYISDLTNKGHSTNLPFYENNKVRVYINTFLL